MLLGDTRLERRLQSIVSQLEKKPSESFPSIFSEEAALEGFYRFLRNPSVRWERLLEGHFEQSCSRVASKEEVIMIHDTSLMQFHRERDTDLGLISGSRKGESREVGFPAHFSMAVSADVSPEPLGLIHLAPLRRLKLSKTRRRQRNRRTKDEQKSESSKWINAVRECRRKLGESARIVHVMDREADFYALMANLVRARERFVIRISHTTRLVDFADERSTVAQAISDREVICRREVWINQRRKARGLRTTKRNPPRRSREAALSITATSVEVMRSDCASAKTYPQKIRLNVVHVFESNPPEGEPPVDWKLYTTESVETETQILKIVDIYRSRWLIEEYFKALKTGCSFEERQLESFKTAMTALALLLPVAWQMLVSLRQGCVST